MIAVVGAGIAGLSVAYELTLLGAQVTVFEADKVAGGASGVATCYLEPRLGDTPMRRLEREALARWPGWVEALQTQTGIDTGFRTTGQLRVSLPEYAARLEQNTAEREAEGSPCSRISAEQARRIEPLVSPDIATAVFLPHVRWVDGKKVCAALAEAMRKNGGAICESSPVSTMEAGRLTLADGTAVPVEKVILCNGMGANTVSGRPQDIPAARPVRGVNIVLDTSGLEQPIRHMIKHHRGNMVPADEKRLIVGTTYEAGLETLQVSDQVIEMLYKNAEPILPCIRDLPLLEVNAGLRTKVADGNLRLGRSRENPAVYYSLGHAGSGYLRAPVVAPEFAQFIATGEPGEMLRDLITR